MRNHPASPRTRVAALALSALLAWGQVPATALAEALQAPEEAQAADAGQVADADRVAATVQTATDARPAAAEQPAVTGQVAAAGRDATADPAAQPATAAETAAAGQPAAPAETATAEAAATPATDLSAAVAALGSWRPALDPSRDTNLCRVVEARLVELGYPGVSARVADAGFSATDAGCSAAVDTGGTAANGDVTYFFRTPSSKVGSVDDSVLRQFRPTFELSADGVTATWTPSRAWTLPWDAARTEAYLSSVADSMALPAELTGGVPETVTSLTLPSEAQEDGRTAATAQWRSSDASVLKVADSYDFSTVPATRTWTAAATHGVAEASATLTLTLSMAGAADAPSYSRNIAVSVAPLSAPTEGQIRNACRTAANKAAVYDLAGNALAGGATVTSDVRFATPGQMGVDGRYFKVAYSVRVTDRGDDPAAGMAVTGFRGAVTRPYRVDAPTRVAVDVTVSHGGVSYTRKALRTLTLAPVTAEEVSAAASLMADAKAGYARALLGGNASADAVTGDLAPFTSVHRADDGSLVWARTGSERADDAVVPVSLPGYSPDANDSWRLFRSSVKAVVDHESLAVTRPAADTPVTVDSSLSYAPFVSLAAAHPDDAGLQALVDQPVSATYTVKGTGSGAEDPAARVALALRVIGPAGEVWLPRTQATFAEGTTLEDAIKQMLDAAGIGYDASLLTLTRDGRSYGWDGSNYWQFFVGGKSLDVMPGSYGLTEPVTDAALYYSPWGAELPAAPVDCDPDAPHPDVEAFWPTWRGPSATGAVAGDAMPTGAGTLAWSLRLREAEDWATNVSDPVFVGGSLWVAAGSELVRVDPSTGAAAARLPLAAAIDSTSRMEYADGMVLVPLSGGRVQAVSASAERTLWVTDALPGDGAVAQQSLSSLTVRDGAVFWATCTPDGVGGTTGGYLCAADLSTGALLSGYPRANPRGAGVYWSGPVAVAGRAGLMACGDDAGMLEVWSAADGAPRGTVDLGAPVRTTPVCVGDGLLVAVTSDGVAHRVAVAADGSVVETGRCAFAASSTSTPALAGGRLVVGGGALEGGYHGRLAVIDLATLSVERSVDADAAGPLPGAVQGAPLVSETGGATWVYFTCNALPGALYGYRLGADRAVCLYLPAEADRQYCLASVVPGPDGALYYRNDSGLIFKVVAGTGAGQGPGAGDDPAPGPGPAGRPAGGSAGVGAAAGRAVGNAAAPRRGAAALRVRASSSDGTAAAAPEAGVLSGTAVAASGTGAAEKAAPLPWWPVAAMAAGAAALVALVAWNVAASKRKAS